MKLPLPWMREYAAINTGASEVGARFGSCGFEVASIDGDVIDLEITANRPDCLSVYGLAREAAAAFDVNLAAPPDGPARDGAASIKVSIGDAGCGRYALALATVKVGPSPDWLTERLTAAGVRPINNVVDVTNYVMLETGHPMHAFDVAKLAGPEIRVRRARPGEKLRTLDGVDRSLDEGMLVIADRERPVAIAGVMGGAASEVSSETTQIALESAWFLPSSVRATSKRLGLKTEASARFERGADLTAPVRAIRRALALLEKVEAGKASGGVSDVYPRPFEPRRVKVSRAHVERLLGDHVPDADVQRILTRLGFTASGAPNGWDVVVPAFRVDVAREADLIEEIGRHWGFDRIPARFPAVRVPPRALTPAIARDRTIRRVLCGAGLQEACTFTFMERDAALPFASGPDALVSIANPLSEKFSVLRPSLLPGLLDALVYSRRRETEVVRLFETGGRFRPEGEGTAVGWVLIGPRAEHWSAKTGDADVFDAIGVGELVGDALGITLEARASGDHPWFVPGRSADLVAMRGSESLVVGSAGELRPDLVSSRGLTQRIPVVGGEIDTRLLSGLVAADTLSGIEPLPRFPSIVRDLSIVVSERLPAADLRGTIRSSAPTSLITPLSIVEFDRYQGKGVPDGMISLSIRLTFRDRERTLTDAEVQRAVDAIVAALADRHGAALRT